MPNPIPRPWKVQPYPDRVAFYFKDRTDRKNPYFRTDIPSEFYVRGAVCWPATISQGEDSTTEGFVIVAGQDIKTKRIYVFEAKQFICIDNIINEEGVIQYDGITSDLTKWFAQYRCDTYFWHDHTDTHRRFLIQMLRSEMLNPQPWFVEVIWHDDHQATHALYELITQKRLVFFGGENPEKGLVSPLYQALIQFRDRGTVLPAAKAALTLAMGYGAYPWRSES